MALLEAGAGIALLIAPSITIAILLGASSDDALVFIVARIAGIALLTLALACWLSRNSNGASGMMKAMFIYNIAVAGLLAKTGLTSEFSSVGLWAVVFLHAVVAIWCAMELRKPSN